MMSAQTMLGADPNAYVALFQPMVARSMQQAQALPSPPVPGHGLQNDMRWDSSSASRSPPTADVAQKQQVQQPPQQQPQQHLQQRRPEPSTLAKPPLTVPPVPASARAKAVDQRTVIEAKKQPVRILQPVSSTAQAKASTTWVSIPIVVDKSCPKLLTDERYELIQDYRRSVELPKSIAENKQCEGNVQVELKATLRDGSSLFSKEQWRVARELMEWCENWKNVPA
mmetsp:Transcript_73463/g.164466  ORF Transcript_73463/g.164466 Transcript_73463/m.164466 type:complete len:226 (-) Transcript_73463:18-695(-)